MRKKIYKILEKVDKKIKVTNYAKDAEVGQTKHWGSLSHLNFLISIEENFKIRFSSHEMTNIKSISDVEKSLKKRKIN